MQILVKFPSRSRPHKFFLCLKGYIDKSHGENVRYLITLDEDDNFLLAYTNYCESLQSQGVKIDYIVGKSEGKIHAVNRDMEHSGEWDILVLGSDDMICKTDNWDVILENEMGEYYPDTDGVLYHNDGYTKLNTMCILGRKYFERFNYIYYPEYKSLWADNEFMLVSRQLGKETYFEQVLFRHEHFSNSNQFQHTRDGLMNKNESFYREDEALFNKRKPLIYV